MYTGSRKDRPVLERAYNVCSDLGLVGATLASGGLAAVQGLQVRPGNPVRVMLAQRLSDASEIVARLGGRCMAEYKYDGMQVQAHRTADGHIELFTRRQERVSNQFPDVVELLEAGLGPREAILEGEIVAYDAAAAELRPFQEVMFRRRKHGIAEAARDVPVGLFCFELLYADGQDLTEWSYLDRRARLAEAVTLSDRLRLTAALEVATPPALDAMFEQAVADGSEGLVCKAVGQDSIYQAGARGWQWIKLKRDYRTELADTIDLVVVGAYAGRGRRRGTYGAVLLAAYDPETELYQTVGKCGTGFSDAELAALPARLEPLIRTQRPPGSTPRPCGCVVRAKPGPGSAQCGAHAVAEPHRRLGPAQGRRWAVDAVSSVHRPLARRQGPGTPPPLSNSSSFTAPHAGRRPAEGLRQRPSALVVSGTASCVRYGSLAPTRRMLPAHRLVHLLQ